MNCAERQQGHWYWVWRLQSCVGRLKSQQQERKAHLRGLMSRRRAASCSCACRSWRWLLTVRRSHLSDSAISCSRNPFRRKQKTAHPRVNACGSFSLRLSAMLFGCQVTSSRAGTVVCFISPETPPDLTPQAIDRDDSIILHFPNPCESGTTGRTTGGRSSTR